MSGNARADGTPSHPIVPVVVGLVVLAGGGYLYYSGMQTTANAEAVDATVLSSDVVDTDDLGGEQSNEFTVRVEYRYSYDGETYSSQNLCPGPGSGCEPSSDFRTEMQEFLEDYGEGDTVTAYVPPSNPSNAYLIDTGPSAAYLLVAAVGLVVMVLGAWRVVRG